MVDSPSQTRKMQQKPKSPTTNRWLQASDTITVFGFSFRGKKRFVFSSQSQVQPDLTPDRPTHPARVRFFTPTLSTVLAPLILTQLSKEIIESSHILVLSLCPQELAPKNSRGESEAREPEEAALFGLNLS